MISDGKPKTALALLQKLSSRVGDPPDGRIIFRIKANIGACHLAMGDEALAAKWMLEAYEHEPSDPKARANKMLALLLQRKTADAFEIGSRFVKEDPSNLWVAHYLVLAASPDETIRDPLALIPEPARSSHPVRIAYAMFLRERAQLAEWWEAANAASALDPGDALSSQLRAEAALDKVTRDPEFLRTTIPSNEQRASLVDASKILTSEWDKVVVAEVRRNAEAATLGCNLLASLRVLGDLEQAQKVARQAIDIGLDHEVLAAYILEIALDTNDNDLAAVTISKLPDSPEGLMVQFKYHMAHGNWDKLARFAADEILNVVPPSERGPMRVGGKLAIAHLGPPQSFATALEAISKSAEGEPRSNIIVAQAARVAGLESLSEQEFQKALKNISEESPAADRTMVAMFARKLGKWRTVSDLLEGHVAENMDSEELKVLAAAFASDTPIRKKALDFFKRLTPNISGKAVYRRAAGIAHFNQGDLRKAEEALRRALDLEPNDVQALLTLYSTLSRAGRAAEMGSVLDRVDLSNVEGSPRHKILLAQLMQGSPNALAALAYAYKTLKGASNDAGALLAYFGLIVETEAGDLIPRGDVVEADYWVRLEEQNGEVFDFTIEARTRF